MAGHAGAEASGTVKFEPPRPLAGRRLRMWRYEQETQFCCERLVVNTKAPSLA